MDFEYSVRFNPQSMLSKWQDLIENGEEPRDIEIAGIGVLTNATITPCEDGYTITYDEVKEI